MSWPDVVLIAIGGLLGTWLIVVVMYLLIARCIIKKIK